MMTCKQINERLSDLYDKNLTWRQRMGIKLHLFMCKHCHKAAEQFGAMLQAIHGLDLENDKPSKQDVSKLSQKMADRFANNRR